ncbi:hypothetical protein ASE12_12315 [Aeromicrobium sp. Root236]|uniref:hypothetical protein n=1 Tax=Aeromicrobium sp. Root236 TaxID=1736498 RepID=UPI0006FFD9A9|nr:hypothetical protein [Aeromicrobium sp. Root236]KRC65467.1 hypothetical protein ASE12_12315 [Aeromicrobium sp. Root236]
MSVSRAPVLVGANPGLRLYDGDTLTAYASVWQVDWSIHGGGTAIVLWRDGVVRLLGENAALATWLERDFVRHFPEAEGLSWPEPVVEQQAVEVDIDLATGLQARAEGLEIRMSDVLDRRTFATDSFPLGGVEHSLSLVLAPCGRATLTVDGNPVAGAPQLSGEPGRPSSSAFVAVAEVWCR